MDALAEGSGGAGPEWRRSGPRGVVAVLGPGSLRARSVVVAPVVGPLVAGHGGDAAAS